MAKAAKSEHMETRRIVTPEFRVSYPHLDKPHAIKKTDTPKFSITMLYKKTHDLSKLKLAIKHAKIDEFGPDKSDWPEELESPVQDGDSSKFADKEGYKGHWVIKATSNEDNKPGLVDEDGQPILEKSEFPYAGCFARAQVFARVWEYGGKQGVHFILDHVQKLRDGKKLTSKKSAEEVFGAVAGAKRDEDDEDDAEDFSSKKSKGKKRRSDDDDDDDNDDGGSFK